MARHTIVLTDEEIGLLIDALDSYEYWEHRDQLPHDSGHITILDDQDFEDQVYLSRRYHEDEIEALEEAWEAVKAARALDSKLSVIVRPPAVDGPSTGAQC